jgi:hypothetical protein
VGSGLLTLPYFLLFSDMREKSAFRGPRLSQLTPEQIEFSFSNIVATLVGHDHLF